MFEKDALANSLLKPGLGIHRFMTNRRSQLAADVCEIVDEQREYRELLVRLTVRDLLLRYKQTVMGVGWAVFMPLVNTAVFSLVFMRVAPIDTGLPYPVFAYCGLLAWNFFAASQRFAVVSLTSNANLVTKVYCPREMFPFSAIAVSLVDFAVASLVLAGLIAYYRIGVGWPLFVLPVVVAVHVAFTTAVALLLAMANLFYRDVKYLFEIVLTVWMFASSVVYPIDRVGGRLGALLTLNPMTPIIDAYRATLLRQELPAAAPFAYAAVVAMAMLAVAWVAFHRAEFQFAENI
jgi:ABC-type polysaccharide/polyol phosphate export permease